MNIRRWVKAVRGFKLIRRYDRDGRLMPAGYGVVYQDHACRQDVLAPMPFNVVLRLGYLLYCWMIAPCLGLDDPREVQVIYVQRVHWDGSAMVQPTGIPPAFR